MIVTLDGKKLTSRKAAIRLFYHYGSQVESMEIDRDRIELDVSKLTGKDCTQIREWMGKIAETMFRKLVVEGKLP